MPQAGLSRTQVSNRLAVASTVPRQGKASDGAAEGDQWLIVKTTRAEKQRRTEYWCRPLVVKTRNCAVERLCSSCSGWIKIYTNFRIARVAVGRPSSALPAAATSCVLSTWDR